jgi:hypothetical protein
MRKVRILSLALTVAALATLAPTPQAEAKNCPWSCGVCGIECHCNACFGPLPVCPCG